MQGRGAGAGDRARRHGLPAAAIARAGRSCAEAVEEHEALRFVMDHEQFTHEADDLLGVAALMGRMKRARAPSE